MLCDFYILGLLSLLIYTDLYYMENKLYNSIYFYNILQKSSVQK